MADQSAFSTKPRLRLLLDHFSKIKDTPAKPQGAGVRLTRFSD
jgi:hypothetical protein